MLTDLELLSLFEEQAISNEAWTHEYHIRVASIYLKSYSFEEAVDRVKQGIKKLNAANSVPESQFRGFHETITLGWLRLLRFKLHSKHANSSLDLIEKCPELLNSKLLNEYYSEARLMSLEAKQNFIEPDIKTLE